MIFLTKKIAPDWGSWACQSVICLPEQVFPVTEKFHHQILYITDEVKSSPKRFVFRGLLQDYKFQEPNPAF
jgi:hypothetical protein